MNRHFAAALGFVVGVLFASGSDDARGQTVVATDYGTNQSESLGCAVAYGPDLDGDGFGELAVGANGNNNSTGSVFVLSGRTFSTLTQIDGVVAFGAFGSRVCWCGDLDGDGLSDLAVAAPVPSGHGHVRLYSSATWTLIRQLSKSGLVQFGMTIAYVGDVDGDGIDDQLIGGRVSTYPSNPGSATLFAGKDGSVLQNFGGSAGDWLGDSLAAVGDVNGDGVPDFAIGSPGADQTPYQEFSGAIDLHSGKDGSLLWRRYGNWSTYYDSYFVLHYDGDSLGRAMVPAADFNGDGIVDLLVAAGGAPNLPAYVKILSGADGTDLLAGSGAVYPAIALAALDDYDGDGLPELAAGGSPYVVILSSRDGKELWRTDAVGASYVASIARTGDVDGDGRNDFALGIFGDDTYALDAGRAELRTSNDFWLDVQPNHDVGLNDYLYMSASKGPPGNLAALFLTGIGGTPYFQYVTGATFDATGAATLARGYPPLGFSGVEVQLRALGIDANGRLVQSADETLILP
jgi:FG-GAP repeat protein/VCBS repeat protein